MKKLIVLTISMILVFASTAATRYSYNNGGSVGWSSSDPALGPVTPASAPGNGDNIIITNLISVTFASRDMTSGGSIVVRNGATLNFSGALGVRNGGNLTVQGGGTLNAPSITIYGGNPGGGFTIASGGSVNVSGNFANNNNSDGITVNGSLAIGGNLSNGNNSDIVGTGGISVGGTVSNSGTIGGATGSSLGTLPVELTYFNVAKSAKGLLLSWQTATELNNDFFEVQRSENGMDFYVIAILDGNGTTDVIQNYSYNDNATIAQTTYYRLRQVDFDGAFEYSKTKVGFADAFSSAVTMTAYPNPVAEKLTFRSTQPITFSQLQLVNISGQEVANLTHAVEGYGLKLDVTLPRLEKGLYYVKYQTASGEVGTHKLIIK